MVLGMRDLSRKWKKDLKGLERRVGEKLEGAREDEEVGKRSGRKAEAGKRR